jgi:hypothetical protein
MEIIRASTAKEFTELDLANDQPALHSGIEALAAWARAAGERPDEFWERQRTAVWSRVAEVEQQAKARRWPALAWTAASASIAIATLVIGHRVAEPPQPVNPQAWIDPDQELLMRVERVVHSEAPPALEPAALLTQEIIQHQPVSTIRNRERRHE